MSHPVYPILLIGQDAQTQNWVERLAKEQFSISKSKTAIGGLQKAINTPISLILFDSDRQELSANEFLQQMQDINLSIPVITLTSSSDVAKSNSTNGVLHKPFSQTDLYNHLSNFFKKQEETIRKEVQKGKPLPDIKESEIMVGFRKPANIYKISKQGMVLSLPTEIRPDSRLLFKGAPLYEQMGIDNIKSNRIEMLVTECAPTIQNRFKVVSKFTDTGFTDSEKKILDEYIERYASKVALASKNHGSILIFGTGEGYYDSYRFYFEGSPYKFQFAGTPEKVLSEIQSSTIDVLIIDSDNLDARITSLLDSFQKQKRRLPIILVTGDQNQNAIAQVATLVQDLIIKPINGKMLLQRLAKVRKRWEFEEQVQKKIGASVGVSIETKILVVFKDQAVIQRIRNNGLLLYKEQAIIPTTTIYFRANEFFQLLSVQSKNMTHIELEVVSCQYDLEKKLYRVIANFKEISDHLVQAVQDFLSGKLMPGATLAEPETTTQEDMLDAIPDAPDTPDEKAKEEDSGGWLFLKEPEEEEEDSGGWLFLKEPEEEEEEDDPILPPPPQEQEASNLETIQHEQPEGVKWDVSQKEESEPEEAPFIIPPKPKIQQYSLSDLVRELPQCQVQSLKSLHFSDEFFSEDEDSYTSQLKMQRGQIHAHKAKLQQVAQKYLGSNPDFYKQRFNTKLVTQERAAVLHVFSEQLECFMLIGATLKTVPKGMGISASLAEDSYEYTPYYLIGVPKPQHVDFGVAFETRSFMDREVAICSPTNKDVGQILPDLLKLL